MFDLTPTIPFGKHAGTPITEVDRGYLGWCLKKYRQGGFDAGYVHSFMKDNEQLIDDLINGAQQRLAEDDHEEYQLSPSQAEASEGIVAAFDDGANFVRLQGGAGYGKSFAVRDVVRNLLRTGNYFIRAAAVSYVATQVLKSQLDRYDIECGTLAKTLKLHKRYIDRKEVYEVSEDTDDALMELFMARGDKRSLLIIDEYSMINDEYATLMGNAAKQYGGAILVVGDLKQLPPVGQDTDTIFSSIKPAYALKDPMRYSADSDLYRLEQAVRDDPWEAVQNIHELALDSAGRGNQIFTYDNPSQLFEAFCEACKVFPHEDNRMLFYRRQDVVNANNEVRQYMFGDDPEPLMPGERLMVIRTSDYGDVRYYTGTTLDAVSYTHLRAHET